jgi:hypothetical protein
MCFLIGCRSFPALSFAVLSFLHNTTDGEWQRLVTNGFGDMSNGSINHLRLANHHPSLMGVTLATGLDGAAATKLGLAPGAVPLFVADSHNHRIRCVQLFL